MAWTPLLIMAALLRTVPATSDQEHVKNSLLSKETNIVNEINTLRAPNREFVIGKIGNIFTAIRQADIGLPYASMFTGIGALGELIEIINLVPGIGAIISQVSAGIIEVFFNPTVGSVVKDIVSKLLKEQYHTELRDAGSGIRRLLDVLTKDIEDLEDLIYNKPETWDEGAENRFTRMYEPDYLHDVYNFLGILQSPIQRAFDDRKTWYADVFRDYHPFGDWGSVATNPPELEFGLISLYCSISTYMESIYTRMAGLLAAGAKNVPALNNHMTSITWLRDTRIPDIRADFHNLMKRFYAPSVDDVPFAAYFLLLRRHGGNDAATAIESILIQSKRMQKHVLEYGSVVTISAGGKKLSYAGEYQTSWSNTASWPQQSWLLQKTHTDYQFAMKNLYGHNWINWNTEPPSLSQSKNLDATAQSMVVPRAYYVFRKRYTYFRTCDILEIDPSECSLSDGDRGKCFYVANLEAPYKCCSGGLGTRMRLLARSAPEAYAMLVERLQAVHSKTCNSQNCDLRTRSHNAMIIEVDSDPVSFAHIQRRWFTSSEGGLCLKSHECGRHGYSYEWCRTDRDWAYCSRRNGYTYQGEKCTGECQAAISRKWRYQFYYWCKTASSWDYCSLGDTNTFGERNQLPASTWL